MSTAPEIKWTPETYLAFDRASDIRHEYWNGEVYAMAGASRAHNLIAGSTYAALYAQLRKRPCNVYPSDMRIRVPLSKLYAYPDISIVCGEEHFDDKEKDTLLNPAVLIEVLSPSTEDYDRGKKFLRYRVLESLQEYVLISQDSVRIEHYVRQPDNQWLLRDVTRLDDVLTLPSIGCTLPIADIYEKVTLEPETPADGE